MYIFAIVSTFYIGKLTLFLRWLKGSRKTHYLRNPDNPNQSEVLTTEQKLRIGAERIVGFNPGIHIEISRGPFRKSSQIYGRGQFWMITQDWRDSNTDWVRMEDTRGVRVGTALRMVNQYPSLEALIDRIAELERDLDDACNEQEEWFAPIVALHQVILEDKQRYRSPAARRIRAYLEEVISLSDLRLIPRPSDKKVSAWKGTFHVVAESAN